MEWVRGEMIGKGSYGSVYVATPSRVCDETQPLMAVKSVSVSKSSLLQKEKEILSQFLDCPQILHCFGEDFTVENGERFYNLLLEFASRGNLRQLMRDSGGVLSEGDVRHYTKSVLGGLNEIHQRGYVHCDIKLQNILLCKGSSDVKIADFGLAKRAGETEADGVLGLRGTPLYMSPESISGNEQEAPSDIWALGCIVAEMITGRPAWKCRPDSDVSGLLYRIGFGDELPEIPEELSEQGRDFLCKCFVRDPQKRWSAVKLLSHPFVCLDTVTLPDCDQPSRSPTSAFEFPDWSSEHSYSCSWLPHSSESAFDPWDCSIPVTPSPVDRIGLVGLKRSPSWSFTDSWVTVREAEPPVSRTELRQRIC